MKNNRQKEDAWVMTISGPENKLKKIKADISGRPVSVYPDGANMKITSSDEKTLEYLVSKITEEGLEEKSFKLVEVTSSWEKVFCGRV